MEDIRIYDFDFNLLEILHDVVSVEMCQKYNGVGTGSIICPISTEAASVFLNNRYLVAVVGSFSAIVTGKVLDSDKITIALRDVSWLLTKRVILPFKTSEREWTAEYPTLNEVAGWLFNSVYNTEDNRCVDNIIIAGLDSDISLERQFWRTTAHTFSEVLIDLCNEVGCGHRLIFDIQNKQWHLRLYKGNTTNIEIAEDLKTGSEISLTEDIQNMLTRGYYQEQEETGETEPEAEPEYRLISTEEEPSGIYCFEGLLSGNDNSAARSDLAEKAEKQTASATVTGVEYGKDYELGDYLRLGIRCGDGFVAKNVIVTGINYWAKFSDIGFEPILEVI